jgi:hypothetical protein
MVLLIFKRVPVYQDREKVPKKYRNLRKNKYVTTFKFPYSTMTDILIRQYGLKPNDKIMVFWTKEISLPHFNRYRLKFRKVYYGDVKNLI